MLPADLLAAQSRLERLGAPPGPGEQERPANQDLGTATISGLTGLASVRLRTAMR